MIPTCTPFMAITYGGSEFKALGAFQLVASVLQSWPQQEHLSSLSRVPCRLSLPQLPQLEVHSGVGSDEMACLNDVISETKPLLQLATDVEVQPLRYCE